MNSKSDGDFVIKLDLQIFFAEKDSASMCHETLQEMRVWPLGIGLHGPVSNRVEVDMNPQTKQKETGQRFRPVMKARLFLRQNYNAEDSVSSSRPAILGYFPTVCMCPIVVGVHSNAPIVYTCIL